MSRIYRIGRLSFVVGLFFLWYPNYIICIVYFNYLIREASNKKFINWLGNLENILLKLVFTFPLEDAQKIGSTTKKTKINVRVFPINAIIFLSHSIIEKISQSCKVRQSKILIQPLLTSRTSRPTRSSTTTESSSVYTAGKELPVDEDGRIQPYVDFAPFYQLWNSRSPAKKGSESPEKLNNSFGANKDSQSPEK